MTNSQKPSCDNCQFMAWITKTRGKGNDVVTSLVGVECHAIPDKPMPLPETRICSGHRFYVMDPDKLPIEFARKVAAILGREEQAKKLANSR